MSDTLAELTRTTVQRATSVRLRGRGLPPLAVLDHRVEAAGDPLLIVAEPAATIAGLGVGALPRPAAAVAVDVCPVPLRDRIRASVVLDGALGRVDPEPAGRVLKEFAATWPWPEVTAASATDDLALLRLSPTTVRMTTGCGCHGTTEEDGDPVDLAAYARALPDPLAEIEGEWLGHLAAEHGDTMELLARHAAPAAVAAGDRVRPCAIDRRGVSFRVEAATPPPRGRCAEVRVAFAEPAACPCAAATAFDVLVRDVLDVDLQC